MFAIKGAEKKGGYRNSVCRSKEKAFEDRKYPACMLVGMAGDKDAKDNEYIDE